MRVAALLLPLALLGATWSDPGAQEWLEAQIAAVERELARDQQQKPQKTE